MKYKIKNITHSGRKGIRGEKYNGYKYSSLINTLINNFSINNVEQFKPIKWDLINNDMYEWWDTSEVIGLSLSPEKTYIIETINAIYELESIEE